MTKPIWHAHAPGDWTLVRAGRIIAAAQKTPFPGWQATVNATGKTKTFAGLQAAKAWAESESEK